MSDTMVQKVLAAQSFEDIFTSLVELKRQYREFAMAVHPDRGGTDDALAKLTALHDEALAQAPLTGWVEQGKLSFTCTDRKVRNIRYRHHHSVGPGRAYQSNGFITFMFPNEHADLIERARRAITTFRFPSAEQEKRLMLAGAPRYVATFHAADAPVVGLTVAATPSLVRLDHLLKHEGGKLAPAHAAWITTRLLNLCCWLKWHGRVHHDISAENIYLDAARHDLHLLGGWWHQTDEGAQMPLKLPGATVAELPRLVRQSKAATAQTDLRLVRRVVRQVLGDAAASLAAAPQPFAAWLQGPPAKDAFQDFADWEKVRDASFGERKFVKLEVSADDVYPSNRS